jgi:glucan 1,3-beta-glucosidase
MIAPPLILCFSVSASTSFNWATSKVRGVNLGGWLVGEPWITPTLFEKLDVPDEYSIGIKLGHDKAVEYLKPHWETFYTESDFKRIASWGINTVRIPIGYWAFDSNPYPYATGQVVYLDKAVQWARKYELKVLIDLHGAPGSQNGNHNCNHKASTTRAGKGKHGGFHLAFVRPTLSA